MKLTTYICMAAAAVLGACDNRTRPQELDYMSVVSHIKNAGSDDKKLRKDLIGKSVALTLQTNGGLFFVEAADEVMFRCKDKTKFSGGQVTAIIENFSVEEPDGILVIWLTDCAERKSEKPSGAEKSLGGGAALTEKLVCRPGNVAPSDIATNARIFTVGKGMFFDDKGEQHHRFTLWNDGSGVMQFENGRSKMTLTWSSINARYKMTNKGGDEMELSEIEVLKNSAAPTYRLRFTANGNDYLDRNWTCVGEGAVAAVDPSARSAAAAAKKTRAEQDVYQAVEAPQQDQQTNSYMATIEKVRAAPNPICRGVAAALEQSLSIGRMDAYYETLGKAHQRGCI